MYNVTLINGGKIEFNYVFLKKAKAEEFFRITLLEHDHGANISSALKNGFYISFNLKKGEMIFPNEIKKEVLDNMLWILSISETDKGSKL